MSKSVQRARARRRRRRLEAEQRHEPTEFEIVLAAEREASRLQAANEVMDWYDHQPKSYREVLQATPDNTFGAQMFRQGVRGFSQAERIMQQAMEETRLIEERRRQRVERMKAMTQGIGPKGEAKVAKTMKEFSKGKLHSGNKAGPKVTSPAQAKAIALEQGRKASRAK